MPEARWTPSRVGILLNPHSGRNKRQLGALHEIAASMPTVQLREASSPQEIALALQEWQSTPLDLLVIMGGDGTLQATLTLLMSEPASDLPKLLVIPGGTTNMSAADIGARLKPVKALQALRSWLLGHGSPPQTTKRSVLRVEGESNLGPQFGMFFGVGAVVSGVRYFHQQIRPTGVRGSLGPALALGRLLLALVRNKPDPLLPVTSARLTSECTDRQDNWLLVLASTLDRLLVGSRPYWGKEQSPIHVTAVINQPRRLLRVLPFLLAGRGSAVAREQDGYISHNLNALTLTGASDYILDGELFTAPGPIRVSSTAPLCFLTY